MDVREKLVDLLTDNLPRCGNLPIWDNPLQLSCDEYPNYYCADGERKDEKKCLK